MTETRTSHGPVRGTTIVDGTTGRRVHRHAGIPYAAPPVGERRWRPPAPPAPWLDIRDATAFGPSAPQRRTSPFVQGVPGMTVGPTSEDCLTLNVWAPDGADGLPVLVWIHGGAFVIGGSSLETYDGTHLSALGDVVVVSCNYRLGALGFLTLEGTTNVALLDQVAALRWVQDNVAAFGGDPARVTLFGESAGAGCIKHLLVAPAAEGLFRRAILQSPGAEVVDGGAAAELAASFMDHAGVTGLDALRSLDVEAVLDAQDAAASDLARRLGVMPWCPVVDGDVVPVAPVDGTAHEVDVIVGTTSEELYTYALAMAGTPAETLPRAVRAAIRPVLGGDPGVDAVRDLLDAYAGDDPLASLALVLSDAMLRRGAVALADALAAAGRPIYTYSFGWQGPGVGACHGIDMPFTFGTFDRAGWDAFVGADDLVTSQAAVRLSDDLITSWAAFAATGDPSNERTGTWLRHDPADRRTMELGRSCRAVPHPITPQKLEVLDELQRRAQS